MKFHIKDKFFLIHFRKNKIVQLKLSNLPECFSVNEISKEPAARLSGKLSCNWLVMLVTMAKPTSSHGKIKIVSSLRAMKI